MLHDPMNLINLKIEAFQIFRALCLEPKNYDKNLKLMMSLHVKHYYLINLEEGSEIVCWLMSYFYQTSDR